MYHRLVTSRLVCLQGIQLCICIFIGVLIRETRGSYFMYLLDETGRCVLRNVESQYEKDCQVIQVFYAHCLLEAISLVSVANACFWLCACTCSDVDAKANEKLDRCEHDTDPRIQARALAEPSLNCENNVEEMQCEGEAQVDAVQTIEVDTTTHSDQPPEKVTFSAVYLRVNTWAFVIAILLLIVMSMMTCCVTTKVPEHTLDTTRQAVYCEINDPRWSWNWTVALSAALCASQLSYAYVHWCQWKRSARRWCALAYVYTYGQRVQNPQGVV